MKRKEEKRQWWFPRMRPYIVRHLLGIGAAAGVVAAVALCGGWPVYEGVAQVDAAADDAILTVGQCIEANASVGPLEEVLIKEDIIEDDLLQTKVTNGMCEDMLDGTPDGTLVRRLVAAQSYIQEIELIEGAMRKAADEAAARGPDWYSSSDESLVLFRAVAQTSEQLPAQAQYDGRGDVGAGGAGTGGVEPRKRQAAAAASVGEDNDASIAERLRQKEAAAINAGATVPEARAGARCSTEVEVSDDELEKGKGLYEIIPQIPEEMRLREKEQAGLLVSPVTKRRFEEIRQKHGVIDEESESGIGCVELVDRMKAQLVPLDLEGLGIDRHHPDDIRDLSSNKDIRWGWDIIARQRGNLKLLLDLRYAISREGGQEFRLVPQSPVYEGAIRVTPLQSGSNQEATERPWWWRIFESILERIFGVFGA
jgi:hypothetical protein